jgi:isoamylase
VRSFQRRLPAGVYDERPRLAFARPAGRSQEAARKPGDNAATALKSVVVDPSTYGWAGDTPLGRPFAKTIIYE